MWTFFNRKQRQDDGTPNSGASTNPHCSDEQQNANTASSSSPETFGSGGAALPPTDTICSSTTAGSSRTAEPGQWQPELTSPAEDEMLAGGRNKPIQQKDDDDEDSWCETVTDPALWGNISSDKIKSVLMKEGPLPFTTDEQNTLHQQETAV